MRFNFFKKLNYLRKEHETPRWGYNSKSHHDLLYKIIGRGNESYYKLLKTFIEKYKDAFLQIAPYVKKGKNNNLEPQIGNPWLPCLDSFMLYSMLAHYSSKKYIEVGSGNSTKFARKSVIDNKLDTRIISIDPKPRAEIDEICDEVFRKPVEDMDIHFFSQLEAGDILFIDNSHRCFMNSDVTACFIDIIPRLKPGVIVEIHDIFLPDDYPPQWGKRYYSEQYLLAAYILAESSRFDILMPNAQIGKYCEDTKELIKTSFFDDKRFGKQCVGGSFWLVMKESNYIDL